MAWQSPFRGGTGRGLSPLHASAGVWRAGSRPLGLRRGAQNVLRAYRPCSARTRSKVFQKAASCVVAKLMRMSVLGWRSAWKSAPGASR